MKRVFIVGISMVFVAALGVQWLGGKRALPGKGRHLHQTLPENLPGWHGEALALGATEAAREGVEKILRFSDVYYREFNSSRGKVSLYIAYWDPGAMPVQLVASHTPDRCWVENGWKADQAKHGVPLSGGGVSLRSGEWRIFHTQSQRLVVQFWHLVGAETYDYGDRLNSMPSIWRWWRDAAKEVFRSPPEQYFIRITSTVPFDDLRNDQGWEELLSALAKLGLGSTK